MKYPDLNMSSDRPQHRSSASVTSAASARSASSGRSGLNYSRTSRKGSSGVGDASTAAGTSAGASAESGSTFGGNFALNTLRSRGGSMGSSPFSSSSSSPTGSGQNRAAAGTLAFLAAFALLGMMSSSPHPGGGSRGGAPPPPLRSGTETRYTEIIGRSPREVLMKMGADGEPEYGTDCDVQPAVAPRHPVTPTFTASYPGSGAKMTWNLIEAITGFVTGDDFQLNGHQNMVSIKTHYPSHEGREVPGAENIPRAILLLRHPLHSLPSYYNYLYEMEHHLENHSTRAPLEAWIEWRDANFERQLQVWKRHTEYWVDTYSPVNRLILAYERITDAELGPAEATRVAEFLSRSEGVTVRKPEELPCVWYKVIKYKEAQSKEGAVAVAVVEGVGDPPQVAQKQHPQGLQPMVAGEGQLGQVEQPQQPPQPPQSMEQQQTQIIEIEQMENLNQQPQILQPEPMQAEEQPTQAITQEQMQAVGQPADQQPQAFPQEQVPIMDQLPQEVAMMPPPSGGRRLQEQPPQTPCRDCSESDPNAPSSQRSGPKYIAPYTEKQLRDMIMVLSALLERYRDERALAPVLVEYIDEVQKRVTELGGPPPQFQQPEEIAAQQQQQPQPPVPPQEEQPQPMQPQQQQQRLLRA